MTYHSKEDEGNDLHSGKIEHKTTAAFSVFLRIFQKVVVPYFVRRHRNKKYRPIYLHLSRKTESNILKPIL